MANESTTTWVWRILVLFILLISMALGGWAYVVWKEVQELGPRTMQQMTNRLAPYITDRELQKAMAPVEARVNAGAAYQRQSIDRMQRQLDSIRNADTNDWLLAEAEMLLRMAQRATVMPAQVPMAIEWMQSADDILANVREPGVRPVRKTLARELLRMREYRPPDQTGLYQKVDALMDMAGGLSHVPESRFVNPPGSVDTVPTTTLERVINWLMVTGNSLFRITEREAPVNKILNNEHAVLVRESVQLALMSAQSAVHLGDQAVWESSLARALSLTESWFPENQKDSQQFRSGIRALQSEQVSYRVLKVGDALRELDQLRRLLALQLDRKARPASGTQPAEAQPAEAQPAEAQSLDGNAAESEGDAQ
jgi:uroporphyrin-3 C-methyltransferase